MLCAMSVLQLVMIWVQEPQSNSGAKLGTHVAGAHTLQTHHSCRTQGCRKSCSPGAHCGSRHCHTEECAPTPGLQEGKLLLRSAQCISDPSCSASRHLLFNSFAKTQQFDYIMCHEREGRLTSDVAVSNAGSTSLLYACSICLTLLFGIAVWHCCLALLFATPS